MGILVPKIDTLQGFNIYDFRSTIAEKDMKNASFKVLQFCFEEAVK